MADARRSGGVGDRTVNAVKSSPSVLERLYGGIEDNRILTSVRRGMVLAIPEILVGSFALLLLSLPVGGWQTLLDGTSASKPDSRGRRCSTGCGAGLSGCC